MKKLLAFAILLIFLFLLGGRIVLYQVLTIDNRNGMMESIQNGSVSAKEVVISIDKKDAQRLIDGNEITYQDHRYDITRIETRGNKVIVHAINDAEEEKLMAGLNDMYLNSSHQNPLSHRNAFSLLDDFFKEYTSGKNIKIEPQIGLKQTYSFDRNSSIPEGFQRLFIPPPKIQAA
jgi:hypothetical protein